MTACQPPLPGETASDPGGPATFVGGDTCASCHREEAARWHGSHHDLAMQAAADGTVLGDFDRATFTHAGVTSTFFRQGDAFRVRTDGPDGKLHDYEIAYVFGVEPLQQYLIALPGGRLQALSICWDARPREAGGQRWFHLYPDQEIAAGDPLHWTGSYQRWNSRCAECHSTGLEKNYLAAEDRYDTTWEEIDVACEACHGPGSRHVVWAEGASPAGDGGGDFGLVVRLADGGAWVFDEGATVARRDPPRSSRTEIETCAPCHARRTVAHGPQVPGRPLMDSHRPMLLEEGLYHADGQVLEEVYVYGSFLQSKMYRAGVTCSDCHDPHRLALPGAPDAICARCHLPAAFAVPEHHFHPQGSAGASCVACHMPATTYMVVDPRRDHSLRVPRPDLTVEIGTPNACNGCHRDRTPQWAAAAVAERFPDLGDEPHYGQVLDAGRRGLARAELARLAESPEAPAIVRATALDLLRRQLGPANLATVEAALGDPDPLVRFAALQATEAVPAADRPALAAALLDDPVRGVRLEAARVLAPVPRQSLSPERTAALDAALAEYLDAQWRHADLPESHLNLGVIATQRDDLAAAEDAYLEALELAPDAAPVYVNLADLYRLQGREEDGERTLRRGLATAPDSGELHHALGLLQVRTGRPREALAAFTEAVELAPAEPYHSYVLAVALQSAGEIDRASAVLQSAHQRHPGDRQLLYALAVLSRDRGDLDDAIGYARRLAEVSPGDPGSQALLEQLRARRPPP